MKNTEIINTGMCKISLQDVPLLKQFICPHTDQIIEPSVTGKFLTKK